MSKTEKSDILIVLENLDQMLKCYTSTVNGVANKLQSIAIAVEAQALATKLHLSGERWNYKLPFKEACDVDFAHWYKKMDRWLEEFTYSGSDPKEKIEYFIPDTDYFVDQYYLELEKEHEEDLKEFEGYIPFYKIDESDEFYNRVWEFKEDIERDWLEWKDQIDSAAISELAHNVSFVDDNEFSSEELTETMRNAKDKRARHLKNALTWVDKDDCFTDFCAKALEDLSMALLYCDRVLLSPEPFTFKSLYERLSIAHFNGLIEQAKDEFKRWLNSTPEKKRLMMLKAKLEKEKTKFFSGKWQEALEMYFDIDDIERVLEGTDAGKFIYRYRNDLTLDEVGEIVAQYHKMACFHQAIYFIENDKEFKLSSEEEKEEVVIQIELPNIFVAELKANKLATAKLLEVLQTIEPNVNTTKGPREEKWKWPHVKDALLHLHLIDSNASDTTFGAAIHKLIPSRTA